MARFRTASMIVLSVVCILVAPAASAGLLGFADPTAYVVNKSDSASSPTLTGDALQITSGPNQTRSVWFKTPQTVGPFTAHFSYQLSTVNGIDYGQGVTFTLQSGPGGTAAIGNSGSSYFGYQGVTPSAAVSLEVYNAAGDSTYVGSYANGTVSGGAVSAVPIDARQGRKVDVTVTYNGSTLATTIVDGANSFTKSFLVGDLTSQLGATAYVGFTARSQNVLGAGTTQVLSGFSFASAVPEPQAIGLGLAGLLGIAGLQRRRTS